MQQPLTGTPTYWLYSISMKTQGEIEAAICEGVSRFEQDYMGRGPKDIHAHLLGDFLVVRLQGVLTAAEQHLVKSLPAEKGRDLLKQVRPHLIETGRIPNRAPELSFPSWPVPPVCLAENADSSHVDCWFGSQQRKGVRHGSSAGVSPPQEQQAGLYPELAALGFGKGSLAAAGPSKAPFAA